VRYVGRFAPSPTGSLHIGSLATAVASFVHAKQHGGEWLVRVEDIDPPREAPGAADRILRCLEAFDLGWDRTVLYQSTRGAAYRDAAASLLQSGRSFLCSCTRRELRGLGKGHGTRYPGTCRARTRHDRSTAIRMRVEPGLHAFVDALQGMQTLDLSGSTGDYVIMRRDGLPAYHLAAVVDDAAQGVTHVVRGVDLLPATFAHRHLQTALGLPAPSYFHLPVIVNALGQKLSKQTKALPVDELDPRAVAPRVLEHLRAALPRELVGAAPRTLWEWAAASWTIETLCGLTRLPENAAAAAAH
jgi:glutamyl-Q tRNA(Asp) synthetase